MSNLIMPWGLKVPVKNPDWEIFTPNEAYQKEENYRVISDAFVSGSGFPASGRFLEIRIVKKDSEVPLSNAWWSEPMFMDKVFWVYSKPKAIRHSREKKPWSIYLLEFGEAQRVRYWLNEKYHTVNPEPYPRFILPLDVTQMCFNETRNGYSEHIRYRPELTLTQEEIDREGELERKATELEKSGDAISIDNVPDEAFRPEKEKKRFS